MKILGFFNKILKKDLTFSKKRGILVKHFGLHRVLNLGGLLDYV